MASLCSNCGVKLGFLQRLSSNELCPSCLKAKDAERTQAKFSYGEALDNLISSSGSVSEITSLLPKLAARAALSEPELAAFHSKAFISYIERALEDEYLDEDEESRLMELAKSFGIDQTAFQRDYAAFIPQLTIARINDNRLPILD